MPNGWPEVIAKRGRTSKHFQSPTEPRKFCYEGALGRSLHYKDASGAWQDADETAEESDTGDFSVKFSKLSYFVRVGDDGRRRFYPDRNDLSYWIEFKKPFPSMGAPTRHERWFYWDFAHAVIGVRCDVDSLKFGFRLKDDQAPTSITIPFETQGITRQGRLLLHDGEVVAELRKPIATGSNLDGDGFPVQKECDVVFGPGQVTISLDPTGLEYPIEIDPTIDKQVAAGDDDAHEGADGLNFKPAYDYIYAYADADPNDRYNAGIRFIDIAIAQGATIGANTYITVRPYSTGYDDPNVDIYCNDVDDANDFSTEADVTSRATTGDSAPWVADGIGADYVNSPSITDPVQEVINRALWSSGNALCVLIKGRSDMAKAFVVWAQEKGTSYSAKLHIEYTVGDGFEQFEDGFESGDFGAWDADAASVATKQVTVGSKKDGTYGMEADVDKTDGDSDFYAQVEDDYVAPASDKVYIRCQFRFTDVTNLDDELATSKALMAITDDGTPTAERMAWLILGKSGSDGSLRGVYRSKDGVDTFFGAELALTVNQWYQIMLMVDQSGANPVVKWWTGATERGSVTDVSAGADGLGKDLRRAYFGILHMGNWEKGNYTIHIDTCGVYDSDPTAGAQTYYQSVAGVLSFAGALDPTATFHQSLAGTLSFAGALSKKTSKGLGGVLSFSGDLKKKTTKMLAGTLSFTGALSTSLLILKSVAGTLSFVGSLVAQKVTDIRKWFLTRLGWL